MSVCKSDVLLRHFVGHEWGELLAGSLVGTFRTGLEAFGGAALSHFTHNGTKNCLDAFSFAPQAVDVLRLASRL